MRQNFRGLGMLLLVGSLWLGGGAAPALAQEPGLGGTTWSGSETLRGFDELTFEFRNDGSAIMIDAQTPVRGPVSGTWSRQGDLVIVRFGDCEYRGCVNGRSMSGRARFFAGDQTSWTFELTQR